MNVTTVAPRTWASRATGSAAPPAASEEPKDGASIGSYAGRGAAALAGAGVGYAGAQVAATGTQAVGSVMTQLVIGMMPQMQVGQPVMNLLNTAFGLGIGGGALLAIGAGIVAGGVVAYHAAAGAEKVDDALRSAEYQSKGKPGAVKQYFSDLKDYGAEMRASARDVADATSFGGALKGGFQAGASLGAPIGATAGKLQGLGFGAALGVLASLPLAAAAPGPLFLPIVGVIGLLGAGVGMKIGEPVGNVLGSLAGGAAGAALGAGWHGVQTLLGNKKETQEQPPVQAPTPTPPPAEEQKPAA